LRGIIAAGHELTARAGAEMFERGGNAFDAAVAASFASFVAESALTSAGGGGFMNARTAEGANILYDFFTAMPGLGPEFEKGGNCGKGNKGGGKDLDFFPLHIDFADALQEVYIGRASSGVPGVIAGLEMVHRRHCRLPVDVLLEPAITMARGGVPVNAAQAYFNTLLEPMLRSSEESSTVYLPGGASIPEGGVIVHENMARAFESLVRDGLRSFYRGHLAEGLVKEFGPAMGGLITAEDLDRYRPIVRKPLEFKYRRRTIYTNPPPSSGGTLIAFSLKLLEDMDVAGSGHNSAHYMARLAHVMEVTDRARRDSFDARLFEDGLSEWFLSNEHMGPFREDLAGRAAARPLGDTTHISVADEEGNMVSLTTSVGMGSGFMIPGTGIMMNNMLGEHDLNPQGFHRFAPGVRLSSMMAPTIVTREGKGEIILGTGGSKRIRSAILQTILNIVDFGLPVFEAVNAPRVHFEGGVLDVEAGVAVGEMDTIEDMGVRVKRWTRKDMYFGGVHTILCREGGFTASGDGRRGGAVVEHGGGDDEGSCL